jgi:hypothetical protein
MRDWQPIDTAPRDGREIRLKRAGDATTYTGRWFDTYWSTAPWTWHMKPSEWSWMDLPERIPVSDDQSQDMNR